MTWIVGAAAPAGYAVGISDIRVTFSDGSERDCLQKIYPMARFIAAGFAGSVRIGFEMLNGLAFQLRGAPENMAFLLLGTHPTDDVGIPGMARCSVHILRSPEFVPVLARIGEVVSIGSGSGFPPYQEALASLSANPMSLLHGEMMGIGGSSLILSMVIQKTIEKNPVLGISPHAHICLVYRGFVGVNTNDEKIYPQTGEMIEFRMPKVATTWNEFVSMADCHSPNCAVC